MEIKHEISLIDQKIQKCKTMVILNRDSQIRSVDKCVKNVSNFKLIQYPQAKNCTV